MIRCVWCDKELRRKDEISLNLKLLGGGNPDYYCIDCLAEYLDCTRQDLENKIVQFRNDGCTLFR